MSDSSSPRQLALSLDHRENFAPEDFLTGPSNMAALALVQRWPDWPAHVMALVGPEGSGKSHLAAVWSTRAGAPTLPARALAELDLPSVLATGALVVEDLAPEVVDERALFHLLNLAREEGASMLLIARTPPAGWTVALSDLASRLRALPTVHLAAPDDALLRALLVKLFADRQLAVDESLIAYLVSRIERSFAAARNIVTRLDREALRQQRPVTRALAVEVLRRPE
ncbi:MAG TPA: chromosomal replication initiator DnaA [Xanthobacteraceae bacterium]|nr:chromosomal replication initiator DnaA [Xanthobacteraceae bacterium]